MRATTESKDRLEKTIKIAAPAGEVWRALTDPVTLNRWMLDDRGTIESGWHKGDEVIIRAQINGKYESKGTVLESTPPNLLRYSSWTRVSRLPDKPENYSIVAFELAENGEETILKFTNANLIAEAAYEHANFYWSMALLELKKLVEAGG